MYKFNGIAIRNTNIKTIINLIEDMNCRIQGTNHANTVIPCSLTSFENFNEYTYTHNDKIYNICHIKYNSDN